MKVQSLRDSGSVDPVLSQLWTLKGTLKFLSVYICESRWLVYDHFSGHGIVEEDILMKLQSIKVCWEIPPWGIQHFLHLSLLESGQEQV